MANKLLEEATKAAKETFWANAKLKKFMEEHPGECFLGIIRQEKHQPWRINLYWQEGVLELMEKPIFSTKGEPVPIIAYCEVDKITKECILHLLNVENIS